MFADGLGRTFLAMLLGLGAFLFSFQAQPMQTHSTGFAGGTVPARRRGPGARPGNREQTVAVVTFVTANSVNTRLNVVVVVVGFAVVIRVVGQCGQYHARRMWSHILTVDDNLRESYCIRQLLII